MQHSKAYKGMADWSVIPAVISTTTTKARVSCRVAIFAQPTTPSHPSTDADAAAGTGITNFSADDHDDYDDIDRENG